MDLRLSPEDEAFRQEVREFIRQEWHPVPYREYGQIAADMEIPEIEAQAVEFQKKLNARGWYTMHWPKPWGSEAPLGRQIAYREEMGYHGAPTTAGGFFPSTLMAHGKEWQKEYFLPRIAESEIDICQGFSEPNAGTDLASLQTRAVKDGDSWIVTGQKIWTSAAYRADWGHFLVRSNPDAPKHRGISYFMIDMTSPGVTRRPLYDMLGRHYWSEVFLDGVRVPAENMIGEQDRGWYAGMTTLNFERTGGGAVVERPAHMLGELDRFLDVCRQTSFNGRPILSDVTVKRRLADLRIQAEIMRSLAYRVAWIQFQGREAPVEGSVLSYKGTLLTQFSILPTLVKIIRHHRLFGIDEERALGHGKYGTDYVMGQGHGFGGGGGLWLAPNIIATRGLGLPR